MATHTPPTTALAPPAVDKSTKAGRGWRRLVAVLLALSVVLTAGYAATSIYIATQLVNSKHIPLYATPASLGLQYKDITFPSREDHLQLSGWFIPGILPNGNLTAQRTIIVVHGNDANRASKTDGLLKLSGAIARNGFAVLAYDQRSMGESAPAPRSFGLYEQRDVLGAVDFLRAGPLPYPQLGRPHAIAGWGLSSGGSALVYAAAHEPAIRALVSDTTEVSYIPIFEREITNGHFPLFLAPGAFLAAHVIYGIDYYTVRPVDVVAQFAPRPLFFIHGAADTYAPISNMRDLVAAARTAPNAHVQTWIVPGAAHAQCYNTQPQQYVSRIVAFYTATLGPDTSGSH